jgi:hypothetical protein
VCKKALPIMQAYVEQAATWSKDLTRMKARGAGDIENAMRSLEREYGVDYSTLWSLRYRRDRIKRIGVDFYMRLQAAYQAECERQVRKLKNEIAITASTHTREATALVREIEGE